MLLPLAVGAQEVLLPLQSAPRQAPRSKSPGTAVALPFFDDFSRPAPSPTPNLWQPQGVVLYDGSGIFPPTNGVATLDALDATGNLYPSASTSLFPADTLTSQPIRLDGLQPADSLVLSFYYLPGGGQGNLWERTGMAPDAQDSLFVDLYHAADGTWHTVWSRGGISVDSLVALTGRDWQYTAIPIADAGYLDSTFRFRFRNYCSLTPATKPGLTGNCDYWHLDYVYLDRDRSSVSGPAFRDIAFAAPAPSMLTHYRAMPARQYRTADMAPSIAMAITNLYPSDLATRYAYTVLDNQDRVLYTYDGGYENAPPFLPSGTYQTAPAHATPATGWAFPESNDTCSYHIVHTVQEGSAADQHPCNDTATFRQVFSNYYAYDDGTAENGYGITSTSSTISLAYRFDLNTEDTLTALDLYFNRTLDGQNAQVPFLITVWQTDDGRPGTILYQDSERRQPGFEGLDRFHRYPLEAPVIVDGSIFVGFRQESNTYINLGFDRSHNTSDRIRFLTGSAWEQSILSGSLMMRPCFGTSATLSAGTPRQPSPRIFPNPAADRLHIDGIDDGSRLELYDYTGRLCLAQRGTGTLSVAHLPAGLYLLRIVPQGNTPPSTHKIIITR